MMSRRVALAAAGGNLALAGLGLALAAQGGGWLLAAGGMGFTLLGSVLDYPWQVRRTWLLVQYSAPPTTEIGALLLRLAAVSGQGVTWIWQRQAGELHALLGLAGESCDAAEQALAQSIPGLRLTRTTAPERPAGPVYRYPPAACDPTAANPTLDLLTGDGEVRIQLTPHRGAILVAGPRPAPRPRTLHTLWRPWTRLAAFQRLDQALLDRYSLLDPWPTPRPALRLPLLGDATTAPLNRHSYRHYPLPAAYTTPNTPAIILGWTTGTGQPVAVPLTATPESRPLVLQGADPAARSRLVAYLAGAVIAAGGSILHLDFQGDAGTHLAAALPSVAPEWIDLTRPGASRRLNLLTPPTPLPATGIAEQGIGFAVGFLQAGGALPLGREYSRRLADEAYLQLAAYYRSAGTADPQPEPTLWTVYQRLTGAGDPGPRVRAERAAWPETAVAVQTTLTRILTTHAGESSTDRRFAATALTGRLRPLLEHPSLIHFWRDAGDAPARLTDQAGLWLGRLTPLSHSPADLLVTRQYAAYLLACVTALAATPLARPLWLILTDTPDWLQPAHFTQLAAGGVTVVAPADPTPGRGPQGTRITLDGSPTPGGALRPGTALVHLPTGVTTIRFTAQET